MRRTRERSNYDRRPGRGRLAALAAVTCLMALITSFAGRSPSAAALSRPDFQSGSVHLTRDSAPKSKRVAAKSPRTSSSAVPAIVSQSQSAGSQSGVIGGALFGGTRMLAADSAALGRKPAIIRVYYTFGEAFPKPWQAPVMAQGSTLLISLDTFSPGPTYDSIAAGHYDGYILTFLKAVNSNAVKYRLGAIYMAFEHEVNFPTHHQGLGTPAEFVRAWDHIHQLAASAGLNWNQGGQLHWVLILSHLTYANNTSVAQYWPGAKEVDIVGADGYDGFGCGSPRPTTPLAVFGPVVAWAHTHGNFPVFLAEWGASNGNVPAQTTYIQQMQAFVTDNPEVAAALYWDSAVVSCSYVVSGQSLAALAAMGHSAALQGHIGSTQAPGYWAYSAAGNVYNEGGAPWFGSEAGQGVTTVVGMAATSDGRGYWLVTSSGTVYAFGNAPAVTFASHPAPIIGAVGHPTPAGGFWAYSAVGNVYNEGGAPWFGSEADRGIIDVSAMAATPDGKGYWLVTSNPADNPDVYSFGDATGGTSPIGPDHPITGAVADPNM